MAAANYENAIRAVFTEEGGYSDNPKDPGGPTNFGITLATLSAWRKTRVTPAEVRTMQKSEAEEIYRKQYAEPIRFDDLPAGVDLMVLDFAVNSGPATAAEALQRAVGVSPDGVIGAKTLAALSRIDPLRVINLLHDQRLAFLRKLRTWPTFGKGWTGRVERITDFARDMELGVSNVPDPPVLTMFTGAAEAAKALPTDVKLTATTSGQTSLVVGAAGALGIGLEIAQLVLPQLEGIAGARVFQYLTIVVALAAAVKNVLLEKARIARGQAGV